MTYLKPQALSCPKVIDSSKALLNGELQQIMSKPTKHNSSFDRILRRMSPEVIETLTPIQLEELQRAVRAVQPGKHAIDIRLSIPFPGRGFYFVIFAGRERRSIERLRAENPHYPYTAAAGVLTIIGLLAIVTVPTILWLIPMGSKSEQDYIHPTAIPWLQDEPSCQTTGREWREGKCWEQEWSHTH